MSFNREAYDIIEEALKLLKTKTDYPYARMVGYLQASVGLEDAKRVLEIVEKMESDKR